MRNVLTVITVEKCVLAVMKKCCTGTLGIYREKNYSYARSRR
jgi:hypothetical protein